MTTPTGPRVRVRKLRRVEGGVSPGDHTYVPGTFNWNVSLPLDYELEGYEMGSPQMLNTYKVFRTKRNGVEVAGLFESTQVSDIMEDRNPDTGKRRVKIKTANSVYEIDYIG